jgi:hypothetical protein
MKKLARGLFAFTVTTILFAGAAALYTDAHAACRMRPQCSTNADCDSVCGAGLGRCVHSNCPIRVCKCS